MSSQPIQNSTVKVVGTAVDAVAASGGVSLLVASYMNWITPFAALMGGCLSLTLIISYSIKTVIAWKESKIRQAAMLEENRRLNELAEYALNSKDHQKHKLTPDQVLERIKEDRELLELLRSALLKEEGDEE